MNASYAIAAHGFNKGWKRYDVKRPCEEQGCWLVYIMMIRVEKL